jgi:FkbM family methyltransferase
VTELVEVAIAAISKLPLETQDDLARGMLALAAGAPTPLEYNPTRQVSYRDQSLVFNIVSGSTLWRVDHFFDAEPETLEWLTRLTRGDVFYDVGANVGMYSIVAAKVHGARVYSFEPEGQNFATLNKNIVSNRCGDAITAYCIAIMDKLQVDSLNLSQFTIGSSLHAFGEPLRDAQDKESDQSKLERFEPYHRQGSIAFAIDDLIARGLPPPTFLKIDVDGFEDRVIAGSSNLLAKAERMNVLVEANANLLSHRKMLEYLESLGYRCVRRGANCIYARGQDN